MPSPATLLTADDQGRIAALGWYARGVVEGLHQGMHRSSRTGVSVDFKEHRPYVRGDEVRSIDWKLYGKTDRLFVRRYEQETSLTATLVVDQSGSMAYAGSRGKGVSKQLFATRLAACLSYLFMAQHDAVGLVTFDRQVRVSLPARSRVSHLDHLLHELAMLEPGGETRLADVLAVLAGRLESRGVVFLISDGFDRVEPLLRSLALLRQTANELIFFQVWHPDELDFPFSTRTCFRSLEAAGEERVLDPLAFRQTYQRNLRHFQDALATGCSGQRVTLVPCRSDESHASLLARFIDRREAG
jgi:uncharacterized protein (DUF58 family)